ncbi:MAG: hypothetical protein PHT69_02055 [Bacteroidales bacterium]|nr:hypothetical protein [Bacteroidales bacterium]
MNQKLTTQVGAGTTKLTPTMNIIEVDTSEGAVELIMPSTTEIQRVFGGSPVKFVIQDVTGNAATNNITIKPNPNTSETVNNLTEVVLSISNIAATIIPIYGLGYAIDPNMVSGGGGGSNGFKVFNFNYEDLQPDDTTTKFLPIEDVAAGNYTVETFYQQVQAAVGVDGIVSLKLKSPSDGSNLNENVIITGQQSNTPSIYTLTDETSLGVEFSLIMSLGVINDLNAGEWNIYYRITAIAS